MKQDPELLKKILELAEEAESHLYSNHLVEQLPGYTFEQIGRHVHDLKEENLVKASFMYANNQLYQFAINDITLQGRQFLKAIRNETVWRRLRAAAANGGQFILKLAVLHLIEEGLDRLAHP